MPKINCFHISYEKYFMPVVKPHRSLFAKKIEVELDNFNDNNSLNYKGNIKSTSFYFSDFFSKNGYK